jgi:hypothetical protein
MYERISDEEMESLKDEADPQSRAMYRDMVISDRPKSTQPKLVKCPKCAHRFTP